MAKKKEVLKKMLYVKQPELTNNILRLCSAVRGLPETTIAEELIIDAIMPISEKLRSILKTDLLSDEGAVKEALKTLFRTSGSGYGWSVAQPEILSLVQYAYTHATHGFVNAEDPVARDLKYDMRSIADFMYDGPDSQFPFCMSNTRRKNGERAKAILNMIEKSPGKVRLDSIYNVIIENWDILKHWTTTHHVLAELVELDDGWDESPEAKLELIGILKRESEKWDVEKSEELPLVKRIMDLQFDIIVKNYYGILDLMGRSREVAIEINEDRDKFNMYPFGEYSKGNYFDGLPEYYRKHLDGNGKSIKTLCFKDIPESQEKKEDLFHDLKELYDALDEDMKQFREEYFEKDLYPEFRKQAERK